MIRQFVYNPGHLALGSWPSGTLRLEGIEVTEEPDLADVFVCPGSLRLFEQDGKTGVLDLKKLNSLPYFQGNESRHVFFDVSDNFKTPISLPIIFIRCDARDWMLKTDTGTIQMAWPVADFGDIAAIPEGGFEFDISCHHWKSSAVRIAAAESCLNNRMLKCDIKQYADFTGYLGTPGHREYNKAEYDRRWNAYRHSLQRSRIALCGESIAGVFPYRFWETLSAGRVPLLVGNDFTWPWQADIPYESFSIVCPRDLASQADQIALTFLRSHSDKEIIDMGKQARTYFETYLDSRRWPELHGIAVTRKLEELKAKCA